MNKWALCTGKDRSARADICSSDTVYVQKLHTDGPGIESRVVINYLGKATHKNKKGLLFNVPHMIPEMLIVMVMNSVSSGMWCQTGNSVWEKCDAGIKSDAFNFYNFVHCRIFLSSLTNHYLLKRTNAKLSVKGWQCLYTYSLSLTLLITLETLKKVKYTARENFGKIIQCSVH